MHRALLTTAALTIALAPHAAAAPTLDDFVKQYPRLACVDLHATVTYTLGADAPAPGVFTYTARNAQWRSHSSLDPKLAPDINTDVAFDGAAFFYHMLTPNILSVSAKDDGRAAGLTLPNPLFAAAQFLIPPNDEDLASEPVLEDFRAKAATTNLVNLVWNHAADARDYTDLPGAVAEETPYTYRIYAAPDDHSRPLRIDLRAEADGATIAQITMSGYQTFVLNDGADADFATSYTMTVFDPPTGAQVGKITMVIDTLEFNTPAIRNANDNEFRIDFAKADKVWLNDEQVFLKN